MNWSQRYMLYEWFSYSHWGMFRLPIIVLPDWMVAFEYDDDLVEPYDETH